MEAGHIRPLVREDIGQLGRLFMKVYRHRDAPAPPGFAEYFERLFFTNPMAPQTEAPAGLVYVDETGRIQSAMPALPIQFLAGEKVLEGRMMCAFMSDPEAPASAGKLGLTMRPRSNDFGYSDTAAIITIDGVRAMRAEVLPAEANDWYLRLPRFTAMLRRAPPAVRSLFAPLLKRTLSPRPDGTLTEIDAEAFITSAPEYLQRFAVRPRWSEPELRWLIDMARQNTRLGELRFVAMQNGEGRPIGCAVFFHRRDGRDKVLNILSSPNAERMVVGLLFHHLELIGCTRAHGIALPHLMTALSMQPGITYRHRGFVWIGSRFDDVKDAARRSDIYIGGLAGEGWSRLINDFH